MLFIAAPVLLLAADVSQLAAPTSVAWTLGLWGSFVLFVPIIVSLTGIARAVLPRAALVAGAAALVGAIAGATMQGYFRVLLSLDKVGLAPDVADSVQRALAGNPMLRVTLLVPGILFPIGLLLLSITLWRGRLYPRGRATLLGLGATLFPVGHAAGWAPALIGGDLLLLGALAMIGLTPPASRGVGDASG